MKKEITTQTLKLKGKTAVFIDWANVYGWTKSLEREVDPQKLFKHLSSYPEVKSINFYFGTDSHPKSILFLEQIKEIGYRLVTKPVKHITIAKIRGELITQRKCDFDIEIVMDIYARLEKDFDTFVFFTGDGDFEPIYKYLIDKRKQVVVIYAKGHLGKEIWEIRRGIFKVKIKELPVLGNKLTRDL